MSYTWHSKDPFENQLLKSTFLTERNIYHLIFVIHKNGPGKKDLPSLPIIEDVVEKTLPKESRQYWDLELCVWLFLGNYRVVGKKALKGKRIRADTLFISPVPNIRFLFFKVAYYHHYRPSSYYHSFQRSILISICGYWKRRLFFNWPTFVTRCCCQKTGAHF